jgi:predicted O-linked N-acetylglucosamine transferase (SPINDLY family)
MSNTLFNAEKKLNQGKLSDAHKLLTRALKKEPENAKIHYLLGETLLRQEHVDESIPYLMKAVSSGQAEPCWYVMCGVALERKGQYADAEKSYQLAEKAGCQDDRMYYIIGNFHINVTKNYSKAEIYFANLIAKKPNASIAYLALSRLYILQERYEEAIQALDACLKQQYETAEVYINLGHALCHQGRQQEALACNKRAIEIDPDNTIAKQNYLVQLLYTTDDQALIYDEVQTLTASFNKSSKKAFNGKIDCQNNHTLRLGFVSADLRQHAIAYYFKPILEHIDTERFSLNFYYNNIVYDEITEEVKQRADLWRECLHLSDRQLEEQIRADKIDILIDLSNHTLGNRLTVFTQKPAPLQLSWMGLPVTTGLDCMDYALKDKYVTEACQLEKNSSEKVLPVDNLTLYSPLMELPKLSEPPCVTNGYITFGSFNGLRKINQTMLETWAKILHKLPSSRIRMVIEDYNNPTMREYLYDLFAQFSVDRARVDLKPSLLMSEYMASHNEVDIALDPYPYQGQTTSFNSLLMGLPLVSRRGKSVASNISSRILSAIHKESWIGQDFDDYIEIALSLAQDTDGLITLRKTLRQEIQNSYIMDYKRLTERIESALVSCWLNLCKESNQDADNISQ